MGFLKNLFSKKGNKNLSDKDNRGSWIKNERMSLDYWNTRMASRSHEPFVIYRFDTEAEAKAALLEIPSIHIAEDTGNLICTSAIMYGFYQREDGKFEAMVCGNDLTHDEWRIAKESFTKHGGTPTGQGDLEPEKTVSTKPQKKPKKKQVVFVKEDIQNKMGVKFTYRIYKGPDAETAKAFLAEQPPITKNYYYLIVETPEGNYGRDISGIYKE